MLKSWIQLGVEIVYVLKFSMDEEVRHLAIELWAVDVFQGRENLFSTRVWPLGGQLCSSEWLSLPMRT